MNREDRQTPERPLDPPEEEFPEEKNPEDHCAECGAHLPHMGQVDYCTEHLEGQPLIDYAANLKECRDKLVEENRELNVCLEKAHKREEDYARTIKTLIDNANQFLADSLGITKGEPK